jgi:hypothetical protein
VIEHEYRHFSNRREPIDRQPFQVNAMESYGSHARATEKLIPAPRDNLDIRPDIGMAMPGRLG